MTDSKLPPEGSERAAWRLRAAAARIADKPELRARVGANPPPGATERLANGARVPPPPPSAARPRSPDGAPPERVAGTGQAAPRAPSPRSKGIAVTAESYPPLSDRVVNGIDTALVPAQRPETKRFTPRSPRTALEPDKVDMPVRRRRSTRARHPLVIIGNAVISIFLILAVAAGYVIYVGKQRFEAPGPLTEDRVVNIPRMGVRDISTVLMHEGVIDQPWVFIGGVMMLKARDGLKAGEYQFKAHASLRDVVATILEGKVVMHQISIPEGLTSEQIVAKLMENDVLTGNINDVPAEGSLLPDTYKFSRGMSRERIIARMQHAEQVLLKEIWDRRSPGLPISTPAQLVVLASLIEKETGRPDERTRIAAVFVNRLKQRMRLQSDPTIIYGLVGGKGTLGRPIMKSEIDQPTAYNTYQIDGLPPGPITNPGRAALEAAANPARTRDLYFVADGTGGHAFAETYEQHQKNVLRLRHLEAGQRNPNPLESEAAPPAQTPAPARPATHRPLRRRAQTH